MPDAPAPDREQRLERIKSAPKVWRPVYGGVEWAYVELRAGDRGWLLAELARVEQERERLRGAAGNLALAATEQSRPSADLTKARHVAWKLIYGAALAGYAPRPEEQG